MSAKSTVGILVLIILLRLGLGVAYSALNPLGEAPDEADHYAYAAYIGKEHRLPDSPSMTQAKHPPLYHLLAATVASAITRMDFAFLRSNPDVGLTPGAAPNFFIHTKLEDWPWQDGALAMHLGRLVSVLAGVALTWITYGLGRRVWPEWPAGGLAAAALVAFLPESLFIGGSMSNDMLAAALSAFALWAGLGVGPACAAPDRPVQRRVRAAAMALLAGLSMGLAFVTKVSTVAVWPVILVAMILQQFGTETGGHVSVFSRQAIAWLRRAWARALAYPVLAGLVGLAVAAPWLLRNWRLFGDPMGTRLMLATIDQRQGPLTVSDLLWLARGWFLSFFGKFGGAGHLDLPVPFYVFWGVLIGASLAGWLCWLSMARNRQGLLKKTSPAGQLVLWATPALVILSIVSYSRIALGTDQGRLLFPALAPIALLLVGGLAAWLPEQRPTWLVKCVLGLMLPVALLALVFGILVPFRPPSAPSPVALASARTVGQIYGADLELVALHWKPAPGQTGAESDVTLYWRARAPIGDDLRVALRAVKPDGSVVWETKRSPGSGRFSTDNWPAGRVVPDTYRLPPEASSADITLEVGVRPFPERPWLTLSEAPADQTFLRLPNPTTALMGLDSPSATAMYGRGTKEQR